MGTASTRGRAAPAEYGPGWPSHPLGADGRLLVETADGSAPGPSLRRLESLEAAGYPAPEFGAGLGADPVPLILVAR